MEEGKRKKSSDSLSSSFTTGAIALVFLIIGYETALFVHKAAVTRLVANRDHPDTVYVVDEALARRILAEARPEEVSAQLGASGQATSGSSGDGHPAGDNIGEGRSSVVVRRNSSHSPEAVAVREKASPRKVESFRFNPNTASLEELMRLGFSEKQAQSILNYRDAGGRFRRPSDFAKSYVVADSVYARLEPFIDIPLLDINLADSTALLDLPGIGPYFAGKIVSYREQLGGYSTKEQLMEIYHFDREKFDGLKDLITCTPATPFAIWTLPEADLARHPHISKAEAHSIVLYRQHHTPAECTLEGLKSAGILSETHFTALSRCRLAPAE